MMDWPTALFFYVLAAALGGLLSWLCFAYGQKEILENQEKETKKIKNLLNEMSDEHRTTLIDHRAKINMRDAEIALLKKKLAHLPASTTTNTTTKNPKSTNKDVASQISSDASSEMAKSMAEIMVLRQKVETLQQKLADNQLGTNEKNTTQKSKDKPTEKTTDKKDINKALIKQNQILEAQIESLIASLDSKTTALAKLEKVHRSALPLLRGKGQTPKPNPQKGPTHKPAAQQKIVAELKADLAKAQTKISTLQQKLKEAESKTNTEITETLNIKKLSKLLKKGKLTSKKVKKKGKP